VAVGLETGEAYVGMLQNADTSVTATDRDIVLLEPALYDESTRQYIASPYQFLYISGRLVSSVAALSNPGTDTRISTIGMRLFEQETIDDAKRKGATTEAGAD